ncbi:MAG: hypothetical protein SCH98_03765 [Deferrisomatales bacterium]|nr:hypothetical protein [Deferrisomatales bacterium]
MKTTMMAALALGALAVSLGCAGTQREMPDHRGMDMSQMDHSRMPGMGSMQGMQGMAGMEGMDPAMHLHLPYMSPSRVARNYGFRVETEPSPPVAGAETLVHVYILTAGGQPVPTLQVHHERLAHFLIVSENLEEFHHLHAEDAGLLTEHALHEGRFSFPVVFGSGGRYLLALDAVDGMMGIHKDLELSVQGPPQGPTVWRRGPVRAQDGLEARLLTTPWQLEAGRMAVGTLELAVDGEPVTDLRPYLGALAHLAIFRQGATASSHNHGGGPEFAPFAGLQPVPNYGGPKIYFEHTFEEPGRYRIYTQFQRGETLYTLPFDVEVAPRRIDTP